MFSPNLDVPPLSLGPLQNPCENGVAGEPEEQPEGSAHGRQQTREVVEQNLLFVLNLEDNHYTLLCLKECANNIGGETELRRTEQRRGAFSELNRGFLDLGITSQNYFC